MTTATLLWALWLTEGGSVNSGYLKQTYVAAYFQEQAECDRVARMVAGVSRWSRCIQARYVVSDRKGQ